MSLELFCARPRCCDMGVCCVTHLTSTRTPIYKEVGIEETGTRSLEIDPHARDLRARLELPVPELSDLLGPTTQSSHDTRIADFTTAHHNFIPIKHRSYPNTVNYYLDSTNYRLTKTKTIKLTQRLAEFSCMLVFHSFQSEQPPAASSTSTASRRA